MYLGENVLAGVIKLRILTFAHPRFSMKVLSLMTNVLMRDRWGKGTDGGEKVTWREKQRCNHAAKTLGMPGATRAEKAGRVFLYTSGGSTALLTSWAWASDSRPVREWIPDVLSPELWLLSLQPQGIAQKVSGDVGCSLWTSVSRT
jgi:hypothetical protein